ncbi:MAG: glycosyltransferase family 9 protein [Opitutales bacterium]
MSAESVPRRVVLSRPDRMGDVVITSSCLEPVKRALPGVELYLLAQAGMGVLFKEHPALTGFAGLPLVADAAKRMETLAAQLRKLRADCLVHLQPDPEVEWAAAAAEIPRRIGYRRHGDKWLTESLPYTKKEGLKHEAFYNFELLELIGVPAPRKLEPKVTPDPEARERLEQKLPGTLAAHRYAVLHVGAHEKKPRVTPEFFAAAARWLVEERRCYVVLIGADHDDAQVAEIIAGAGRWGPWVFNFCGQTDLAEAAWLLREAVVVFGRDSGPAHLAAAMGARTVTLMLEPDQVNSARRWTPLGERSWVLEKPLKRRLLESRPGFAKRNLRQFEPEEIVAAIRYAVET